MAYVTTLALGSWPKQGLARLRAKKRSPGVKENVREWTLTLPKELPPWEFPWELESWWTLECSKNDCRGQNLMDWRVFYTIEKLLKHRCLKWACMTHLDIWNTSYGQKKGKDSNWQFDSRPLKIKNWPNFLTCRWRAGVPTLGISGLPFGTLKKKCHLDVGLMERRKIYYKGEGGGFPQVWVVMNLVSPNLPVGHPSTKSAPTMH
jgi:hypothetical protein